jgi:RNA polymerase sigma factor (sigma-70 family)
MAVATLSSLIHFIRSVGPAESDPVLLMRFARAGDESAFTELVRRHGPTVLGVCRRILRDGHAAEDAFQATFLLLATKASSLRQPERLANWLYGVAYRTATKLRSRLVRRQTREQPFDESAFISPKDAYADLGPELDTAIEQLPSKYRVPFVLCYLQGLSNAEAAARLGCPTNTVATRLSRARERLRSRLTKQGLTVAVSLGLVTATARSAVALTAGTAGATAEILTLMEGVRTAMMWKKVKLVIATVAILTLTGFGATRLAFRAIAEPPSAVTEPDQPSAHLIPAFDPAKQPAPTDSASDTIRARNFVVSGTSAENGRRIVDAAEKYRKEFAKLWLGKELPDWPKPCPIHVMISADEPGSATSMNFNDKPTTFTISIRGTLNAIMENMLPHEVTHTVMADHFQKPIPRWADEGIAQMSESESEQVRHDQQIRRLLNKGHALRLSYLLALKDYPRDVTTFYAQVYSVTRFLVELKNRATFLEFVNIGMKDGWEDAAKRCYGFESVNGMENAWVNSLRDERRSALTNDAPPTPVAPLLPQPQQPETPRAPTAPISPPQSYVEPPAVPLPPQPTPAYSAPAIESGLIVVHVIMDKDGLLICKFPKTTYYEPVTIYQRDANGATRGTTSYVRKSIQEERTYRSDQIHVTGTNGKPVDAKDLAKRLEKETPVVFIQGTPLDPHLLSMLKEGTLIFSTISKTTAVPTLPPSSVLPLATLREQ